MHKYNFNRIILVGLLIMILGFTTGCGKKSKSSDAESFVQQNIGLLVEALESGDPEELRALLNEDNLDEAAEADIERLINSFGSTEHVYASYNGYEYGKGERDGEDYEEVKNISGMIITGNGSYEFATDITVTEDEDVTFSRLWIITDKTEAVENTDWPAKYHFSNDTEFKYADYYDDSFSGECRLIWGKFLEWNENSDTLEADEVGDDAEGMTLESFTEKYGKYGAVYDTVYGYHNLYYKSSEEGRYTMVMLSEEDTVETVEYTDSIANGETGIKELQY